jgi:hypothetical protein
MNEEEIHRIKAKTGRVKLPLNEMAILRWCAIGGALLGAVRRFYQWTCGEFDVQESATRASIATGLLFGGLLGAVVAVFIAWTIKALVFVVNRVADIYRWCFRTKEKPDG